MGQRVHVDAGFVLGERHTVCEDYALCGLDDAGRPWAVVSDGCSSVSHSDVGARLLAHAAAAALLEGGDEDLDLHGIVEAAQRAGRAIGLPVESLEATLLWARPRGTGLELGICGDGVLGVHRRTGWQWWQLEHPEGAPVYPAVLVDPERRAAHRSIFGPRTRLHRFGGGQPATREARAFDEPWVMQVDFAEADAVLLGSDGLVALHDLEGSLEPTDLDTDAIERHIAAFGSPGGRFVTRRLRRLVKSAADSNLSLPDDIAVAALLWTGRAEEPSP